jgi:hypothetical protein
MSYSYFLLHGVALKACFLGLARVVPTATNDFLLFWMLLPLFFALTLIPTVLLYLTIERPLSL